MVVSRKLVAIPRPAKIHIQRIAPGPPAIMARMGPVMLPTPMRDPMLMQNTWKDDSFPSSLFLFLKKVTLTISLRDVTCSPLRLTVAKIPTTTISMRATYQMRSSMSSIISMKSN